MARKTFVSLGFLVFVCSAVLLAFSDVFWPSISRSRENVMTAFVEGTLVLPVAFVWSGNRLALRVASIAGFAVLFVTRFLNQDIELPLTITALPRIVGFLSVLVAGLANLFIRLRDSAIKTPTAI